VNVAGFIAPLVWAARGRSPIGRPWFGPSYRSRPVSTQRTGAPQSGDQPVFTDRLVESRLGRR
jgi:hypothetical protein